MRHESRRRVTMGADVEMKDGDKKMETKEEEKKAEPVKTLDVLDVVRCVPDPCDVRRVRFFDEVCQRGRLLSVVPDQAVVVP